MGSTFHEIIQAIEIHERELAGQAVAIDGTAWLHQFLKVTIANSKNASGKLVLIDKTCQLQLSAGHCRLTGLEDTLKREMHN